MIDLTPIDVRKKRGDFRKILRGYDTEEVDGYLELVAERMEELVKENLTLRERSERLGRQVEGQEGRERAVQEALVTAQQLRDEVREQARREAEVVRREAEGEIEDRMREAQARLDDAQRALEDLERRRSRFLKGFRSLLQEEMNSLEVEAARDPSHGDPIDLDLGEWRTRVRDRMRSARHEDREDEDEGSADGESADASDREGGGGGGDAAPAAFADPVVEGRVPPEPEDGVAEGEGGEGAPDEPLWLSALLDEPEEGERG